MQNFHSQFLQAKNLLLGAHCIAIISHRSPDGDTVGANLALRLALKYQWNKEVISVCVDTPPPSYDFLPEVKDFVQDFDESAIDAIIVVDCGASYMTKFHETKSELFFASRSRLPAVVRGTKAGIKSGMTSTPPLINIDHHATNDNFGHINIVDSTAASTTQILYNFLNFCEFKITPNIATCLLNGLYYDTGSFMHSNTSPEVLEIAASLMWKGADSRTIARKQFHTMPVRQLKVYGEILERAYVNSKQITVSALTADDFAAASATPDDTTGAIDYLNSIPDGKFCCLLYEDRKGVIKGSFRTRTDDVDLSELAKTFGGGGHKKASGFSLPGRLLTDFVPPTNTLLSFANRLSKSNQKIKIEPA